MPNPREEKPVLHTKKHLARLERERRRTNIILFTFIGILVIVAGLIGYAILYSTYLQAREPVAKVGNVNITVSEWQARVRLQIQNLQNQYTMYTQYGQMFGMDYSAQEQQIQSQLNDPTSLGQSALDQLTDEELIRQEAAKLGITASKSEVDASIQANLNFYPNGSPTPTITPTDVTLPTLSPQTLALVTITSTPTLVPTATNTPSALSLTMTPAFTATATGTPGPTNTPLPTATPYTLQGFQKAYQTSVSNYTKLGIPEDQLRALYAVDILRQKLMDAVTANTPHSQDQIWARHIVVADEATAQTVRQRLLNGEDFAKVAAEVSTDTDTKSSGGDFGWFPQNTQDPQLEAVAATAFSMKVSEISQPVKTQSGYEIIQVLAHTIVPLDAPAYEAARQMAFNDWFAKERKNYNVVTYNNWQNLVPTVSGAATIIPQ